QPPADKQTRPWEGIEVLYGEERTNYPCTLSVDDLGEGFLLTAQVQAPIEPARLCSMMHMALEQLVEALETAPAQSLRSLEGLPTAEKQKVLVEWNSSVVAYPQEKCVHQLFEIQAERAPEAIAVAQEKRQL